MASPLAWTQPCCKRCWVPWVVALTGEHRPPTRLREPDLERCCFCGAASTDGIYVRVNPEQVPCPTRTKEG